MHCEKVSVQHVLGQVQEHRRGPLQQGIRPRTGHTQARHTGHFRRHAVSRDETIVHRHLSRFSPGLCDHVRVKFSGRQTVL